MRQLALVAVFVTASACAHWPFNRQTGPAPNPQVEGLYARSLAHLDPGNTSASLDSAAGLLEAYLAYQGHLERREEARILLRLAGDARQLQRVEAALQQAQAAPDTVYKPVPTGTRDRERDGAALREIERLKEQLAKANAELDRIRKRLANPPPSRPPAN
jgi:hypothetical protein